MSRLAHSLEHDLDRLVRTAAVDDSTVAFVIAATETDLLDNALEKSLSAGDRVGAGPRREPREAHLSWRAAKHALVFAVSGGSTAVVHSDDIGPLVLLAALPGADLAAMSDVAALRLLAESRSGREVIATLECLVKTGSIRQVSAVMRMHHSSIANRIRRAEAALGYALGSQDGMFRARLALEMWRIAESHPD